MRRPSTIRLAVAFSIFGASMTSVARAEPPHLEAAPELGCPPPEVLRQAIGARLGKDDFDKEDAPSVTVAVRRATDGTLSADLSVTTSMTSTRTLEGGESCVDLVRAAALAIALAIEQDAPPPVTAPPVERPPVAEVVREDARVVLGASVLTAVGLTPSPTAGVGVQARYRFGRASLSTRGFWLPDSAMSNGDFRMRFAAGGVGACLDSRPYAGVAGLACAHLMGGSFGVISASTPLVDDASRLYVGASASAGAHARVAGPVSLEATIDGEVPFTRPTILTSSCPGRGFEPPFVALALWFGVSVSIF